MLLTKEWLMGVRRGWLSLLHPAIHDFKDVYRALGRMLQFVQNLRDQINHVRQAYYKDDPKLVKAFDALIAHIKEEGYTAQRWSDSYEGLTPGGPSTYERAQGEQMLNLYRTNFKGAMEGGKTIKKTGLNRMVPITAYMDAILKQLYAQAGDVRKIEELAPGATAPEHADSVFREFAFGNLKVVIVDPKHRGARIRTYIEPIEQSHQDLRRKGFGSLWYGTLFIVSDAYAKLDAASQEAYARAGYKNLESTAGVYHSGADVVKINAPPQDFVRVLVHEMGHRFWYRKMTQAQRARFESLLSGSWSMVHALLLNQKLLSDPDAREMSAYFARMESGHDLTVAEREHVEKKFNALGLRAGVMPVSDYARTNAREAFAEVFEKYVAEQALTRDQVESFRSVIGPLRANQTRGRLSRRPAPQRRNGRH